jgi:hypothetical protein
LLHVGKKAMMLAMSREPKLSSMFVKYLLKRNIRYQDDLVDQLFIPVRSVWREFFY